MTGALLECRDLRLSYGATQVLRGVELSVAPASSLAILGPSGSGKSSLLYCLAGLEAATGHVSLLGRPILELPDADRSELRLRHYGFVFQESELVAELSLAENIALPLELLRWRRSRIRERTAELIERLGLTECADRRPHQVSGRQRQRAAIARAVATRPAVILADEPTGALDSGNRDVVAGLLFAAARDEGAAVLVVTHDQELAGRAVRAVQMSDGRIVDQMTGTVPLAHA